MMKRLQIGTLIISGLLYAALIISTPRALALMVGGGPISFTLIGTFVPLEDRGDSKTFELWVKGRSWHFKVTQAYDSGSSSLNGWRLLNEIVSRRLKLIGSEKVIQPLMQPDIVGKDFELKGRLYVRSNSLFLSSASEILEAGEPPGSK